MAIWEKSVRAFDWRAEKEVCRFELPEQAKNVELNRTGEYVVISDESQSQVFSVKTGRLAATLRSSGEITARNVRNSSRYIAMVCQSGVEIYELASGVLAGRAPLADISSISFSESEELVALASKDGSVEVRRLGPASEVMVTLKCDAEVTTAVFAPDSQWVATGTKGKIPSVQIWELPSGNPRVSIPADDDVRMLAVSPDGKLLASQAGFWIGGDKKEAVLVRVWDADSGTAVARLPHDEQVLLVHFVSPQSVTTVSAFVDLIGRRQGPSTLTTWTMDSKPRMYSLRHEKAAPVSVTATVNDVILVRMGSSIYPWKPGNDESVVEPLSDVNANAVALYRNIKRLKLDVNQHVPIHGNPGSNADFERIVGPVAARAPQQGGGG